MQIAGAVVDNCNTHLWPPGSGNRPMTSDCEGGPRRTGAEYFDSVGGIEGASTAGIEGPPPGYRSRGVPPAARLAARQATGTRGHTCKGEPETEGALADNIN